ncbi:TetR/AcrR family transcriptional regulator [Streptomyces sp. NPDC021212]|uniref:TetR/AcrR family transcriptional regulator n=1 Tax=Streptomyces sp. NPDC021212 TaxID=3365118 RepID=UPI003798023C
MTEGFERRTPSRWGEGGALKEEILAAAARMLTESGREGDLSLRAVAREVGISAPSVYLHFKDRAELVRVGQRFAALRKDAHEAANGSPPRERVAARTSSTRSASFRVSPDEAHRTERCHFGGVGAPSSAGSRPAVASAWFSPPNHTSTAPCSPADRPRGTATPRPGRLQRPLGRGGRNEREAVLALYGA